MSFQLNASDQGAAQIVVRPEFVQAQWSSEAGVFRKNGQQTTGLARTDVQQIESDRGGKRLSRLSQRFTHEEVAAGRIPFTVLLEPVYDFAA